MKFIDKLVLAIANNHWFTFISSSTGIIGFYLTIKVKKAVDMYKEKVSYNKQQKSFMNQFNGYRLLIIEGNIGNKLLNDIEASVMKLEMQFKSLLTLKDRWYIFWLKRYLSRDHTKINKRKLVHNLTYLYSRFHIKED